jgi:phage-related protein
MTGKVWTISFYVDRRGNSPVLEFINALPVEDRAKIDVILKLLEEFGTSLRMPHAKHIKGHLWELRPGGNRLFFFVYQNEQFVILHGFKKKTKKAPKGDIEIATNRMREFEEK